MITIMHRCNTIRSLQIARLARRSEIQEGRRNRKNMMRAQVTSPACLRHTWFYKMFEAVVGELHRPLLAATFSCESVNVGECNVIVGAVCIRYLLHVLIPKHQYEIFLFN